MSPLENKLLKAIQRDLAENRLQAAAAGCRRLNTEFPHNAEGWWAASLVATKLGNPASAMDHVDRALAISPSTPRFLLTRANSLIALNRPDEAVNVAHDIVAAAADSPAVLNMAGAVYNRCADYESAKTCYETAIARDPENSEYHYNLAAVLRYLGDTVGAEVALDRVLSINPGDCEACHLRSDIRTQTPEDNHIEELQQLLQSGIAHWRDEMKLCFALAKELEDVRDYEASFRWLKRACDLRRRHMSYRVDNDLETIEGIIEVFSQQALAGAGGGFDCSDPIFIVGLPRTGTTLVERILSSHSHVFSAGELNNFAQQLTRVAQQGAGGKLTRRELLQQSAQIDFHQLGRAYFDSTRHLRDESPHFIDKMPLNFLYCGLIHRALPRARIIHVTRSPMDACYAMYKRLFKGAYPMSYDLDDLGRYYLAYRKLMRHWHRTMPGVIYTLAYEDLVEDQEQSSRRLIEHCGLDWQEACLRFEENTSASATASASQVRQAIYRSSVGKWRHYATQLAPLREILQSSGIDVENDPY